jgi:hypothetical protein
LLILHLFLYLYFLFQSDKERLGQALLSDAPRHNRELMALILKVEERELVQECLTLVDTWIARIDVEGEAYTPPDAPTGTI